MFRTVLGIYGFILGALAGSAIAGTNDYWLMVLSGALGGLLGALILILAYFVGVALIGAALGALAANLIWAQLGTEPHPLLIVLFSVIGALLALALQRYVIIVSTSFGGAWTTIIGVMTALGYRRGLTAPETRDLWLGYPPALFSLEQRGLVIAWLVLGLLGLIFQVAVSARGRK
jgi:hypothetical protein